MKQEKYVAYVGTYTHENSVGIHIYDVDVEAGKLTERKVVPINNPSDLVVSKDRRFLYSIADEGVAVFDIKSDGDLEMINKIGIDGMRGCYLSVDATGQYLLVAGYHDGTLHLLDLHGREFAAVRVESDEDVSGYLHGIVADGDGFLAAVFAEDKRQGVNGVFIVSVGGDGRERWRSFLPVGLNNTYAALTGDGTGGAYFMKADDGDYRTGRMVAIDATGTPRWEKTVALDGLIMSSAILGWDGGAVTVDARGVSKSKGVYDVVHLRISPEGTLLSATARDFSCRPDYSFTLRRAAEDGAIFAESEAGYLDTKGTKHVLVPVDALPEIAAPNVIVK